MTDIEALEKYRGTDGFIHLQRKYSTLYTKSLYTTDVPIIINTITEYDLKSANISAMEASGKFSKSLLDELRYIPKLQREIIVGKMRRADKNITKIIQRGITNAKGFLFEENHLMDSEIVTIKNDAVFVAGRKLKYTEFGPYKFVPKNRYSLFMKLDKQLEFYYDGRRDKLDIKGLGEDVVNDQIHQQGMIIFFKTVFGMLVKGRIEKLREYLIQFVQDYKEFNLPVAYYKEFNHDSIYRYKIELTGYVYRMTMVSESDKELVNGIYNYTRYILPFVQAFM